MRGLRRWAAASAALVAVALGFAPGALPVVYALVQAGTIAVLVRAIARRRAHPAWWLFAVAVTAWVTADLLVTWTVGLGEPLPWDSPIYLLYAVELACFLAGLLCFLHGTDASRDLDASLDVGAVFVAAAAVAWELVVEPRVGDTSLGLAEQVASSSYAAVDVVLLALCARLLLVTGRCRALHLLAGAIGLQFTADMAYAVTVRHGAFDEVEATAMGLTYLAVALLVAAAASHPSMDRLGRAAPAEAVSGLRPARMAVTVAALVTPVPLAVASIVLYGGMDQVEHLVATSLLMAIAGVRLVRLLRRSEQYRLELLRRKAYYREIARHSSDAILVVDDAPRILDVSPSAAEVLRYDSLDAGTDALELVEPRDRPRLRAALANLLAAPGVVLTSEARIRRGDGSTGWYELRAANLLHDEAVRGLVVNLHDVTDRKEAERALAHQAFHDPLTGLANRQLFGDRVGHALARSRRAGQVAVLFCDLDGFKAVNDTLGHVAGDELLRVVAQRATAVVRAEDTVARLGGDEIAVLLEGDDVADRAGDVADRLLAAVQQPVELAGTTVVPGVSIGVAVASGGDEADDLLRDADIAMYAAKAAGKGRVTRFREAMRDAVTGRLQREAELRQAIDGGELELRFQPVVHLRTAEVTGFEALVRWRHPERGLLPPIEFLPLAEETGLVVDLGRWVLEAACTAAAGWEVPLEVAVNVSGRELADAGYPEQVAAVLRLTGLDPARLCLELTESVMVDDPDGVAARLVALRELGIRVAIDDFGTGYSALQYLRDFPVDVLKMDRSFVEGVDGEELPPIVRGVIELSRSLGVELLAEGIERAAQRAGLAAGGCERGQGFLFARPLPAEEAAALARTRGPIVAGSPTGR